MSEESEKPEKQAIAIDEEGKVLRQLSGVRAWTVTLLGAALCVLSILHLSGFLELFRIYLYGQIYNAAMLGGFIVLTLLIYPATSKKARAGLPWYDALLIVLGVVPMLYQIIFFRPMVEQAIYNTTTVFETILAIVIILVLLEVNRRSIGWPMSATLIVFALHPLVTSYLPGIFGGVSLKIGTWASMMYSTTQGILGEALNVATTIVIAFVIFGQFLQDLGGGKLFTGLALALLGRFRGGPAKGAVMASAMFGTISGSAVANVLTTGIVTIPLMKKCGYQAHFAGAVEAAASNGGQIMPPVMGVIAFLMAELLGVPYVMVVAAAVIPAILYFGGVYATIHLEAVKFNLKGIPREQLPSVKKTFNEGWIFILPLIVLIILLIVLQFSPQMSGLWSLGGLLLVSMFRKSTRPGPRKILDGLANAGKSMCMVVVGTAGAGMILSSLGATGFAVKLSTILVQISGGNLLPLLLLTAITSFVLGTAGSTLACYIMLVPLVVPALAKVGALPIASHMFLFYWAMISMITPPVAVTVFAACSVAGSDPWKTGWVACRLVISAYIFSFAFVYRPALLAIGPPLEVLFVALSAAMGVIALSAGLEGYLLKSLAWVERVLCLISGVAMILPIWTSNVAGVVVFVLLVILHVWRSKGRQSLESIQPAG